VMVEMVYHIKLNEALGPEMSYLGTTINTRGVDAWVGAVFLTLTGVALFELARRQFHHQWGQVQEDIEAEIHRRALL
jgi:branched-chain amino acid transport system permease protein